jgi:hypothetical protein
MRRPSNEVVTRLLEIDADFFGRDFETASGTSQLACEAWLLPGAGDRRIIQLVNRVVVPRAALASAEAVLARVDASPPVVCIEDV